MNKKNIYKLWLLWLCIILLWWCFWSNKQKTHTSNNIPKTETEEKTINKIQVKSKFYEYINKEYWFKVIVPSERSFQEKTFWSIVMFFSPTETWDTTKENLGIVIEKLKINQDLTTFANKTKENLEYVITDYKLLNEKNIKIWDINAIQITYNWKSSNQKLLQRQQLFFIKENTSFVLTYTATQDTFDLYIDWINTITNSFSFK
jgi:hypothetical protein